MASLWRKILGLKEEAAQSTPAQPAIHEILERPLAHYEELERWKQSFVLRRLLDWLGSQYAVFLHDPKAIDEGLDFLQLPSSQGFIVYFYSTNYTKQEAVFFFDYLKERVQAANYRIQLSDTRTYNRDNWVETVEKHYLKPRTSYVEGTQIINQLYGNIAIELEFRDDKVHHLRFRATHYADRLYAEPAPFRDLMGHLLK